MFCGTKNVVPYSNYRSTSLSGPYFIRLAVSTHLIWVVSDVFGLSVCRMMLIIFNRFWRDEAIWQQRPGYQAITWTNIDPSSQLSCGGHLGPKMWFRKTSLKMALLKLPPHLSGASELTHNNIKSAEGTTGGPCEVWLEPTFHYWETVEMQSYFYVAWNEFNSTMVNKLMRGSRTSGSGLYVTHFKRSLMSLLLWLSL